jgi:hypothetical protein
MRSNLKPTGEATPYAFLRFGFAVVAFTALTLYGSVSYAEDEPADDSKPAALDDAAPSKGCTPAAHTGHPQDDHTVCNVKKTGFPSDKSGSSDSSDLASKLANPSAPIMALNSFLDIKQNGGSAPGAHRASFTYSFQPAIPFPTKRGNVILRPLVPIEFGAPYPTAAGTVDTAVAFGNISLDTLYGKTLKSGFMVMGGFSTLFPTNSKSELRADWALGPEVVLGFASKKTGNVWGTITQFTWSFPTRADGQNVGGQYFYGINLGSGWQINANPVWSYSRETKVLRFPLGIGLVKVAALGKKNFPVKVGVQIWGYTPPPDGSGPEWQLRITIAPVVPLPWKK